KFIQRSRVLSLYREILRTVRRLPPSDRSELCAFARREIERHSDVEDLEHIRYLLATGRRQFDEMRGYVHMGG
ncbi:hypothetical protein K470DRAFT_222793, partial [Piedraia hortae CBS 480.64]